VLAAAAVLCLSGCVAAIPLAAELLTTGGMGSIYGVGYTQPNPFYTPVTAQATFPGYAKNGH